jgi:arsenate reductase-like glutaredoxin family protein
MRKPEPTLLSLSTCERRTQDMATKEKKKASRVVKGQELEVEHLTEIADVSPKQARALLRKHGADWTKLKDEAEDLKQD